MLNKNTDKTFPRTLNRRSEEFSGGAVRRGRVSEEFADEFLRRRQIGALFGTSAGAGRRWGRIHKDLPRNSPPNSSQRVTRFLPPGAPPWRRLAAAGGARLVQARHQEFVGEFLRSRF